MSKIENQRDYLTAKRDLKNLRTWAAFAYAAGVALLIVVILLSLWAMSVGFYDPFFIVIFFLSIIPIIIGIVESFLRGRLEVEVELFERRRKDIGEGKAGFCDVCGRYTETSTPYCPYCGEKK